MDSMPSYAELSFHIPPIRQTPCPAATPIAAATLKTETTSHADATTNANVTSLPNTGTISLAGATTTFHTGAVSQADASSSSGSMHSAAKAPAVDVTSHGGNDRSQGQPVWLGDVILGSRVQFLMSMLAPCLAILPKVGCL